MQFTSIKFGSKVPGENRNFRVLNKIEPPSLKSIIFIGICILTSYVASPFVLVPIVIFAILGDLINRINSDSLVVSLGVVATVIIASVISSIEFFYFALTLLFIISSIILLTTRLNRVVESSFFSTITVCVTIIIFTQLDNSYIRSISWGLSGDGFNFIHANRHLRFEELGYFSAFSGDLKPLNFGDSVLVSLLSNFFSSFIHILNNAQGMQYISGLNLEQELISLVNVFWFSNLIFLNLFNFENKTVFHKFNSALIAQAIFLSQLFAGLVITNSFQSAAVSILLLILAFKSFFLPCSLKLKYFLLVAVTILTFLNWSLLAFIPLVLFSYLILVNFVENKKARLFLFSCLFFVGPWFVVEAISKLFPRLSKLIASSGGFPTLKFLLFISLIFLILFAFWEIFGKNLNQIAVVTFAILSQLAVIVLMFHNSGVSIYHLLHNLSRSAENSWVDPYYYFDKALWITLTAYFIFFAMHVVSKKIIVVLVILFLAYASHWPNIGYANSVQRTSAYGKASDLELLFQQNEKTPFMFYQYSGWGGDINLNQAASLVWEDYSGHNTNGPQFETTFHSVKGMFGLADFYTDETSALCVGLERLNRSDSNKILYTRDLSIYSKIEKNCPEFLNSTKILIN